MRFVVVVAACGLALAGCKTAAERQAIQDTEDRTACARIGATPGTDREFQCKLALETQRRNEAATYGAVQSVQQHAQSQRLMNEAIFGQSRR